MSTPAPPRPEKAPAKRRVRASTSEKVRLRPWTRIAGLSGWAAAVVRKRSMTSAMAVLSVAAGGLSPQVVMKSRERIKGCPMP